VPVAIPSMVQLEPTAALAVNRPPVVMDPHLAVQVTGALAVNCWVFPCGVLAETGDMVMGETIVTLAVAAPLPLVAVAVTVQVVVGYKGALSKPAVEIEPHVVVHLDAVLAVNCWVAFSLTVTVLGEMVTAKAGRLSSSNDVTITARRGE
jgi:hypothetical protein